MNASATLLAAVQRQHDERDRLFMARMGELANTGPSHQMATLSHPSGSLGEAIPNDQHEPDAPWGAVKGPQ